MSTRAGATEQSLASLMKAAASAGSFQKNLPREIDPQAPTAQYSLGQFRSPAQYHRHSIANSKSTKGQNMDNSQFLSVPIPANTQG